MRISLVAMPFKSIDSPMLSLSILKPILSKGNEVTVEYMNLVFADIFGHAKYRGLEHASSCSGLIFESLFAEQLYGVDTRLGSERRLHSFFGTYTKRCMLLNEFKDRCIQVILESSPDVLCLSATFSQLLPSIWLAVQLKHVTDSIRILIGGAACSSPMGEVIAENYKAIDMVVSGPGERLFEGTSLEEVLASGVRFIAAKDNIELSEQPFPDYIDFLTAHNSRGCEPSLITIPFESSRGCLKPVTARCRFCGLDGPNRQRKEKGVKRLTEEITRALDNYRLPLVAVDNYVNTQKMVTVLNSLGANDIKPQFWFEVHPTTPYDHLKALRAGGLTGVQVGIESLSTHLLRLMNKGTTAIANLLFLKWARELDIRACWNLLLGIPGETDLDYEQQIALFDLMSAFQPPVLVQPVRIDRYSDYHNNYRDAGWSAIQPMAEYRVLYPRLSKQNLNDIAYHFEPFGQSLPGYRHIHT